MVHHRFIRYVSDMSPTSIAFQGSTSGDTTSYSGGSWATGSATVTVLQAASPPITGLLNLLFGEDLVTGKELKKQRESLNTENYSSHVV